MSDSRFEYYDLDHVSMGEKNLSKIFRALIFLHGHFTDSFACGIEKVPEKYRFRGCCALRVALKPGTEGQFEEMTGLKLIKRTFKLN